MTRRYAAKYVYAFTVTPAALTLLAIPHITNKHLMLAPMIGFGIDWASIMGAPFMIVMHSILKEHYGVYMGVINMMIVTPMFIETVISSRIYKTFLDVNPSDTMVFTGVPPIAAASLTVVIRMSSKPVGVSENV